MVKCGLQSRKYRMGSKLKENINCVDHPADCNLFKKHNPVKFAIIRPLTSNCKKIYETPEGFPTRQPV